MKALLPLGFDLHQHLNKYPPKEHGICKFNSDHALYILSQITLVPARNKDIADEIENGLTPLYSKLLQKTVRHYNDYLKYFIKTGVIYTDGKFKPSSIDSKGYSRGYRFTDSYERSEIESFDYSQKFVKHLRKKRKKDYLNLKADYGHLTKWLWPTCRLEIDADTAKRYLKVRRDAQLKNPSLIEIKIHPIYGTPIQKDPEVQYRHAKANVENLLSGDIGCSVDGKVGRMHTVLTNIKSDLRNLITYEGKQLVSIDIKNSQPYLSTLLFNKNFWETEGAGNKKSKIINYKIINKEINKEINNPSLILALLSQVSDCQDIRLYIELVSAKNNSVRDDLYTFMMKESSKILQHTFADRDEVKKGMFEVLFSKNTFHGKTGVKKLFKELFPSINPLFSYLKKEDHSLLPRLLQSLEAYIVLKVITKAIHRKNKNIPLFTIHDSITTTVEYTDTVMSIMEKELTRLVGWPPKLKKEPWQPSELKWKKYQSNSSFNTGDNQLRSVLESQYAEA